MTYVWQTGDRSEDEMSKKAERVVEAMRRHVCLRWDSECGIATAHCEVLGRTCDAAVKAASEAIRTYDK